MTPRRHFVIPDAQIRPGVPTRHIDWVAQAIVDYMPDTIVNIGDWWDMPSLSMHDGPGSMKMEGARYEDDVQAGNDAFERLCAPMEAEQARRVRRKIKRWTPRKLFLFGNHENRIYRAVCNSPKWAGTIGEHHLKTRDWERHPYLSRVWQDGILYSHFFQSSHSSHAIGGTIDNRLNKIGASFVQGHEQGFRYGTRIQASGANWHGLVAGSCLTPDHKVLTADLRYVPLGDVRVGDKLVSFDEQLKGQRYRRYRTGTVEAVKRDVAQCFRVVLDTGKEFKVTGDHYWLTRVGGPTAVRVGESYLWRQTSQLRVGTRIPRPLDEWETDDSRDGGYLSGIYDGEGSLYARETNAEGGAVMQLSFAQRPGLVLDECLRILSGRLGMSCLTHTNQNGVSSVRIKGGAVKCARLLGALRPVRLLAKFRPELLGSLRSAEDSRVVSIEPIGEKEIVRIAIDHKTMIVEGYPHHNCYLHDEEYRGAQGQGHWRGVVVLNEVQNGDYCVMPLTLDYLCRKYEGMSLAAFLRKTVKDAEHKFWLARAAA